LRDGAGGRASDRGYIGRRARHCPIRWADVFQQGEIDSIGERVALTQDPGDFARLPVDDARQDQVQAAAGVHLLPQLAGVDPAPSPVKDVPGQGVELLDLKQAAPDAAAQLRLREVLEDELGRGVTRRPRASESPTISHLVEQCPLVIGVEPRQIDPKYARRFDDPQFVE
jgi:hypothetical protein